MHNSLKVKQQELEASTTPSDYLNTILSKYYDLWEADPDNMFDNFNDEQHCLLAYNILCGQVENGGFIQLFFNGYGGYIFDSPLSESLREWGLSSTADLLDKVRLSYSEDLEQSEEEDEEDSMEKLSALYEAHPEFEEFDDLFYELNEMPIMKEYIEKNIEKFISLEK